MKRRHLAAKGEYIYLGVDPHFLCLQMFVRIGINKCYLGDLLKKPVSQIVVQLNTTIPRL